MTTIMNCAKALSDGIKSLLTCPATLFFLTSSSLMTALPSSGQSVQHLTITQPGGMPGLPVITGVSRGTNGINVTWDGPSGYYQIFQKLGLADSQWQAVGGYNLTRRGTITTLSSNAFFRVAGPSPRYAGADSCTDCHTDIHANEMNTRHAHALELLAGIPSFLLPSCLPCHTVGYGLPSGYKDQATTPHLAGVQCESCHGPSANHADNENNAAFIPRVEIAATVCGGCHTDSHHPTYDEWKTTGHATVTEDMNNPGRISSCGRCHSGNSRLALLKGKDPAKTVAGDANIGIVCITCHDPHQTNSNPAQLRNPVSSSADYFLSTSDNFAAKYNPQINVCAQCHNHRGASWTSTSRPPHHSPQYNMLIGTVGELTTGLPPNQPAAHAWMITNQCVGCHMQTSEYKDGPPEVAAVTGHKFKVETYGVCLQCHPFPELLIDFTAGSISNQIMQVKTALDRWATTKAPAALSAKYGVRAWEYTNPGGLSNPSGVTTSGPIQAEQSLIPANIMKARFNMYLVYHDGSFGVHNAPYAVGLLDAARTWIQMEMNR